MRKHVLFLLVLLLAVFAGVGAARADNFHVTSVFPLEGSGSVESTVYSCVPCDTPIQITFDRELDHTTVAKPGINYQGPDQKPHDCFNSATVSGNVLTIEHKILPDDSIITVVIPPDCVEDSQGNYNVLEDSDGHLCSYIFSFLTQAPAHVEVPDHMLKAVLGKYHRITNDYTGTMQHPIYPAPEVLQSDLDGLGPDFSITYSNLGDIWTNHSTWEPELRGCYITDLTGLEHMTNVQDLTLDQISDGNQSLNTQALAGMTGLTSLTFTRSHVGDSHISPLASLTNLTSLDLSGNQISDITPLGSLTNLASLTLTSNPISNIAPLANLTSLTSLDLSGNQIGDISSLGSLTDLTSLTLSGNQISDITPLGSLTSLASLTLTSNPISNIAPLASLTSLTSLDLSGNQIGDISPLGSLKNLTTLNLADNPIIDTSSLQNLGSLTSLASLDLSRIMIRDISPLEGLTGLTTLNLGGNLIKDIASLAGLTSLTDLDLSGNMISNISSLKDLTGLTTLNLGSNYIRDISALEGLTGLTFLDLSDNRISDLAPLKVNCAASRTWKDDGLNLSLNLIDRTNQDTNKDLEDIINAAGARKWLKYPPGAQYYDCVFQYPVPESIPPSVEGKIPTNCPPDQQVILVFPDNAALVDGTKIDILFNGKASNWTYKPYEQLDPEHPLAAGQFTVTENDNIYGADEPLNNLNGKQKKTLLMSFGSTFEAGDTVTIVVNNGAVASPEPLPN